MEIHSTLTKLDRTCDYVPGLSTLSNLVDLFQKCFVIPSMSSASIENNRYHSHLNEKSALRCIALLIPLIGNVVVALYDITHSQAKRPEPNDHSPEPRGVHPENTCGPMPLKNDLLAAINTQLPENHEISTMVHFHTLVSCANGAKLVLGNDRTRQIIGEKGTNQMAEMNETYDRLGIVDEQVNQEIQQIKQFDMILSFNGKVRSEEEPLDLFPQIDIEGVTHLQYPISENLPHAYARLLQAEELQEIFTQVDRALSAGKTVLFHCNGGEHRSATMMVVYLVSRAERTFEEVHAFVQSRRDIKPYQDDHDTLMTEAYRLASQR